MTTFDLDAAVREAGGEPFAFDFGGEHYELPPQVDLRAAAAFSDARLEDGLRLLLGAEQWQRLQASPAVFSVSALKALLDAYGAHMGQTVGESQASTGS